VYLLQSVLLLLALGSPSATFHANQSQTPAGCDAWERCRELALAAREAGEAETFHDLAWRAVQTRGRRDPDLLFLLARAQSLSGRPHDALVTLQRLATEFAFARDVSDDEDFRRVRALPGWPDVQALIARIKDSPDATIAPPNAPETTRVAPVPSPKAPEEDAKATPPAKAAVARKARFDEVARFAAPRFAPGGLAYDAVSRRFVVGNLPERKLTIVAQDTNRAATLAGEAARMRGVRALEIDRRSGDLWVISGGTDEGDGRSSELHKLQLVSGRVLDVFSPEPELGPSRFVDVAVGGGNGVLVLDAEGPRLLRPPNGGKSLAKVIDLPAGEVTSLAPAGDGRHVFVAYSDGLVRVDLTGRTATPVAVNGRIDLSGFTRLRWHRGTLVGLREADGSVHLVRLRLVRGNGTVSRAETLDSIRSASAALALDVLHDELYYLVPGTPEAVIRRIQLK
jgi:hypothetical protein